MRKIGYIISFIFTIVLCSCSTGKKSLTREDEIALDMQQRKFNYFFLEGVRQKQLNNHDAAFDLYRKALSADTANAQVRYELANYYLRLGRPVVALDYLERAYNKDKKNFWYAMTLAGLYQNLNRDEDAVNIYRSMADIYPGKPEINYALSDAYSKTGEYRSAIDALNLLEENIGMMQEISIEKFKNYYALEESDSAFMEIRNLISNYPTLIEYKILLGDLYLNMGMLEEANAAYEEAMKDEPDNAYLLLSRSDYFNRIGDIAASNALLTSALTNEKLDVQTKEKLLTNYLQTLIQKKESLEHGDSLFTIVIEQHPQEPSLKDLYSELLIFTDRPELAREQISYAVDLNPNEKKYWLRLIGLDINDKKYDNVIKETNRAMEYLPSLPELYLYQGVAYSLQNKSDEALKVYKEGIDKIEKNNVKMISVFWGQIGDIYHKKGNIPEAYFAYDEALKYDDKNISVLNNYSYFLSLDKSDLSKAERMAAQAVKVEPDNATFLDTYAWIFFQQGNYSLAKFYIESALEKEIEENAEMLDHYGDILFKLGEEEKALEQWEKAYDVAKDEKDSNVDLKLIKKKIANKKYYEK